MPNIIMMLRYVIQQGGLSPGGINIRLPFHNGLYEPRDLVEAYISHIDMYAKGLRIAIKLINDAHINRHIQVKIFISLLIQHNKISSVATAII